jgi:hypothetical protein
MRRIWGRKEVYKDKTRGKGGEDADQGRCKRQDRREVLDSGNMGCPPNGQGIKGSRCPKTEVAEASEQKIEIRQLE